MEKFTVYLDSQQVRRLKNEARKRAVNEQKDVGWQVLLREGVELVLARPTSAEKCTGGAR